MPDRSSDEDHADVTRSDVRRPTSGDNPVDSVDNAVTLRPFAPRDQADSPALNTRKRAADDQAPKSATESDYPQLRGPDLARAALQAAKEAAGGAVGEPGRSRSSARSPGSRGAGGGGRDRGADERDPQPLGRLASRIAADRGWTGRLTTGQLFGRWAAIVGEDVAEHAQPVSLKDGELTIQAALDRLGHPAAAAPAPAPRQDRRGRRRRRGQAAQGARSVHAELALRAPARARTGAPGHLRVNRPPESCQNGRRA